MKPTYIAITELRWFNAIRTQLSTKGDVYWAADSTQALSLVGQLQISSCFILVDCDIFGARETIEHFAKNHYAVIACGRGAHATMAMMWGAAAFVVVNKQELLNEDAILISLIAQGCTNPQIGRKLHKSEDSIKIWIGRLLRRYDARDRANLVANALRVGFIR